MKIKTSKLTGQALDWAVATCEGYEPFTDSISWIIKRAGQYIQLPKYSTDWAQGGPVIEHENLSVSYWGEHSKFGQHASTEQFWEARHPSHRTHSRRTVGFGPTPLIAAMRCLVSAKLGDEVDVPEELL